MAEILVIAEHRKRELAGISLEMLTKGRQLADRSDAELAAVIIGGDVDSHAARMAKWADKVLTIKDDRLPDSLAEPYQKILAPIIRDRKPGLVLIGHSPFGMDLAPALAVEIGAPLATDCLDIFMESGSIRVKRAIYNGKVNAEYSFASSQTVIVTGRSGEFHVEEAQKNGDIEKIESPLTEEIAYKRFEGYVEPEAGAIDITKSGILVSVGRGIKNKESVVIAEELARRLGGDVACSRPVVDYGWLPPDHQVGMSGKAVKPKLYLALGISGAFQHTIGIKGAEVVVAVNIDPKAPIFRTADYGIVDDIFAVVSALTRKIDELKG